MESGTAATAGNAMNAATAGNVANAVNAATAGNVANAGNAATAGNVANAANAGNAFVDMPMNAAGAMAGMVINTKNEPIEKICTAITTLTTDQRDRPEVPSEFPIRIAGLASSIMRNITIELNQYAASNAGVPHSLILASAAISLHSIVQASLQPAISMPFARKEFDSKASSLTASKSTSVDSVSAANECSVIAAEFFNLLPTTVCAKSLKWHSDGRAAFYILQSGFKLTKSNAPNGPSAAGAASAASAAIRWANAVALLIATGICGDDEKSYFR